MWNEIVKNEIWVMDDFLNEETVEHDTGFMRAYTPFS